MHPFAGGREPTFEKFQVWRGNDDVCVELAVTKSTREKIVRADSITIAGNVIATSERGFGIFGIFLVV
jgi:hypothetical protein